MLLHWSYYRQASNGLLQYAISRNRSLVIIFVNSMNLTSPRELRRCAQVVVKFLITQAWDNVQGVVWFIIVYCNKECQEKQRPKQKAICMLVLSLHEHKKGKKNTTTVTLSNKRAINKNTHKWFDSNKKDIKQEFGNIKRGQKHSKNKKKNEQKYKLF